MPIGFQVGLFAAPEPREKLAAFRSRLGLECSALGSGEGDTADRVDYIIPGDPLHVDAERPITRDAYHQYVRGVRYIEVEVAVLEEERLALRSIP
jgi:hypothetical protein